MTVANDADRTISTHTICSDIFILILTHQNVKKLHSGDNDYVGQITAKTHLRTSPQ